jgi:hypothetical protein
MRLVETVIAPGTAFLVTMTNGNGDSEQHGFYLKGSTVARLSSYPTARYQLSPIDSIETVYHHIITMWNVQQQPAAPATSVRLPEATMRTMQHQIAAGHTISHIATLLAQASIPRSTGEVLATALTTPRCNSSLAMLHRKEHVWLSDGIGMLDSATGLWQLQSLEHQGISWIELSPCDASTLATRVRDLLSKGAPVGNYM